MTAEQLDAESKRLRLDQDAYAMRCVGYAPGDAGYCNMKFQELEGRRKAIDARSQELNASRLPQPNSPTEQPSKPEAHPPLT